MPRHRKSKSYMLKRNGIWQFRRVVNGKNVTRSLHTRDEVVGNRKAQALLRAMARDGVQILDRRTVEKAMLEWLPTMEKRTERDYRTIAQRQRDYVIPALGKLPLVSVTTGHIEDMRDDLLRRGLSKGTVRNILSDNVRCFFAWAKRRKYVTASPFEKGLMPKLEVRLPDRLTDDEVERVLGIPEPHAAVVRLGLGTGLRWGEQVRVDPSDLQKAPEGGYSLDVPKAKSRHPRSVPVSALNPELTQELRRHIKGKFVPFAQSSSGSFNNFVRRHSGVKRFHVHMLRHTFGCRYMESGGELLALKEIMGHDEIETTLRYAGLASAMVRRDAARVHAKQVEDLSQNMSQSVVELGAGIKRRD